MQSMKKVLAIVLTFCIILSLGAVNVLAYSDVNENSSVGEAVGILSNLGIFEGFEDGTFRPDDTVTRAQMAAIICRTLSYEDQAKSSGGNTVFSDVSSSHWASGYINVAQQIGVINGYGDGTFGPEDKVTYEQAVKMIVCALGYELAAQSKGGYPTGYLSIASSEGIAKNSGGKVGSPAARSTIAILVYNSLEVRLFDQQTWTTNGNNEYAKSDDTILSKYLNVRKWEGVITEVPFTDYADKGYDDSDTPYITIDGFYKEYNNGSLQKYDDESPKEADSRLIDAGSLLGKKVIAYIGDEEDDRTGNYMVYAISEKVGANTVTSVTSTQLVDSGDSEWKVEGQISYRKSGGSKIYNLDLDDGVKFYVNYDRDTSFNKKSSTEDVMSVLSDGGRLDLISNDNNDKIDYVLISAYSDESVIKSVDREDGIYSFDLYNNGGLEEIDTEADDELVIIYRDGKKSEAKYLEEGDTVSTVEIGKDVRVLYVSSDSVTGTVTAYDSYDNTVTIKGEDYELSPFMNGSVSKLSGEEGTFYLNVDGQIAHNETDSTQAGNYGLILAIGYYGGISSSYTIQAAMANGTIAEYDLSSKVKLYDKNGSVIASNDSSAANKLASMADGTTSVSSHNAYTTVANANNMVFKFTMKNGVVSKIKTLTGKSYKNYMESNSKKYDADSMSYGSVEFDNDTVVFSIDYSYSSSNTSRIDKSNVKVGKVSDFFTDGDDGYTFAALDEDSGVYGAVLGFGLSSSVPENGNAVIISAVKTVTYDDSDAIQITGISGGRTVTYTIYDEDDDYAWGDDPTTLSKGDVVLVAAPNSSNVVKDFKLLYKASRYGVGEVTANALKGSVSDDVYNAVGTLNKNKTSNSKFYIDSDVKNSGGIFAEAEDGITIKSSANYTLVDYSESTKNPTIEKKSPTSSLFSTSSKYDSFVFVRVYDDVLSDVVVYRFSSGSDVIKQVETPVITVSGSGLASVTCETSNAVIYYTVDGTTPTSGSKEYSAPVQLKPGETIKVIAVKSGYTNSSIASGTYTVQAATPVIVLNEAQAVITCETPGAVIYYTVDGSAPTASSTVYTEAVSLNPGTTIKAFAVKEGYVDSAIVQATYTPVLLAPSISISGTTATINSSNNSDIYYTTDGTDPTTQSPKYLSAITLTEKAILKAIAVKEGYEDSAVAEKAYTPKLSKPVIKITDGKVEITAANSADIYYTINGGNPTKESSKYTSSITLTEKATVKAIAVKEGYEDSAVAEKSYTPKLSKPVIKITDGKVEITAENGADIYYTINGGNPMKESSKYTASITLTGKAIVKAIAVKEDYEDSAVAEKAYTPKLSKPVIKITDGKVEITAESGADIYYTFDGSTPTKASTKYTTPFTLSLAATVKAIALKTDYEDSDIASASYMP